MVQTPSLRRPAMLDLGLGLLSGTSMPASVSDTKKAHAPTPARKARSRSPRLPCGLSGSPCRTPSRPSAVGSLQSLQTPLVAACLLQGRHDCSLDSRSYSRKRVAAVLLPLPPAWGVVVFMLC